MNLTEKEVKEIKRCLTLNDTNITLKIIKVLEKRKCEKSIKLLFDISNSKEWVIEDSAINAILKIGCNSVKYLDSINNRIIDDNFKRRITYIKQRIGYFKSKSHRKKLIV